MRVICFAEKAPRGQKPVNPVTGGFIARQMRRHAATAGACCLTVIKARRIRIGSTPDMHKLTYLCPRTGMHVQVDFAREADRHKSESHEAVVCQACKRLHFIDVTTGKLLGHETK
jgi:hypothetical protein